MKGGVVAIGPHNAQMTKQVVRLRVVERMTWVEIAKAAHRQPSEIQRHWRSVYGKALREYVFGAISSARGRDNVVRALIAEGYSAALTARTVGLEKEEVARLALEVLVKLPNWSKEHAVSIPVNGSRHKKGVINNVV